MTEPYKGLLEDYERPDFAKSRKPLESSIGQQSGNRKLLKTALDRQSGKKQAILKITGFLSSAGKMGDHIDYITRNGKLELSDHDGFSYLGKGDSYGNIEDWAVDFSPVSKKQSHSKISLRVDAGDVQKVKEVYDLLKVFSQNALPDVECRVDKSRSKKSANSVTLTVKAPSDMAGLVREQMEGFEQDSLQDYKTKLVEIAGRLPRNAMKMMLSSPEGTDPNKVKMAAEAFAKDAFGDQGYSFLYALHTDTSNPHLHLIVKMVNEEGKRLSTDKPDLYRWRELWAEKCQEQGIDVVAVPNYMRGVSSGKVPNAAYHADRKQGNSSQQEQSSHYHNTIKKVVSDAIQQGQYTATQREIAAIKRNLETREHYLDAAGQLRAEVGKIEDGKKQQQLIKIAAILEKEAKTLPLPKTPVQQALESEGKKQGLSIRTILPKDVAEQLRSAFKSIDQRTRDQSSDKGIINSSKDSEQEIGDE